MFHKKNYAPECISSRICLYADDVLLYIEIETREDCIKLQMDLDALQKWERYGKWSLIWLNAILLDLPISGTTLSIIIIFIMLSLKRI